MKYLWWLSILMNPWTWCEHFAPRCSRVTVQRDDEWITVKPLSVKVHRSGV
jgi:hypothetical protein